MTGRARRQQELEIRTHLAAASMQAWLDFELARGRPRQLNIRLGLAGRRILNDRGTPEDFDLVAGLV